MAVLEKIRSKTVFLIAIIGLALFAFIISDFIGKGRFSNHMPNEIGTVNRRRCLYRRLPRSSRKRYSSS